MTTLIIAMIVFSVLIVVHELGHFLVAKNSGMRVEEFSLGMGPKLIGKVIGETLYAVRLLPIGGFVKVSGEAGDDEENIIDSDRLYYNRPIKERGLFLFAGSLMNFALGFLLFTLLFAVIGTPFFAAEIGSVLSDSPASHAGLVPGDKVLAINNNPVNDWDDLVALISAEGDKPLEFKIERASKEQMISITPNYDAEKDRFLIGIMQSEAIWRRANPLQAILLGIKNTAAVASLIFVSLIDIISGNLGTEDLAGPIRIVQMIGETARYGVMYLVNLTALISINLGVINLLPFPPLDGSKILLLFVEKVRGKPLSQKKEGIIHLIGFAFLLCLMFFVAYQDILRIKN